MSVLLTLGFAGVVTGLTTTLMTYFKSNTTTTTYEPDRVEAAKIEADAKLQLANMEKERIEQIRRHISTWHRLMLQAS